MAFHPNMVANLDFNFDRAEEMNSMRKAIIAIVSLVVLIAFPAAAQTVLTDIKVPLPKEESGASDRFVMRAPGEPPHPTPGTWGYDSKSGEFKHPAQTP